jgi:type IV pilus assembly protein PilC
MKFLIEYVDKNNDIKTINVDSKNEEEAIFNVLSNPDVQSVISVKKYFIFSSSFFNFSLFKSYKKLDYATLSFISRQFSQMFQSGLPINSMMSIFTKTIKKKYLRDIFQEINLDLQRGVNFYKAFSKYEKVFGTLFVNMIKVGETSGNLDKTFSYLADYYEFFFNLRNKVINTLIYPIFVIFAVLAIWFLAMFFVVPTFKKIFSQILGGPSSAVSSLPYITKLVFSLSDVYNYNVNFLGFSFKLGYFLYFLKFAFFGIIWYLWNNLDFRKYFENILLKVPFFSTILKFYYCSIFFKSLHITLNNGLLIVPSLILSADSTTSVIFRKKIDEVIENLEQGKRLSESLINTKFFEPIVEQILITGERSGNIYKMLEEADKFYTREMEILMDRTLRLLEPILIVFIGIFVFFILLALYLPIFSLPKLIMGR